MTTEVKLSDDPASREWHLDKRVPIALILTIAVQTAAFGFWAGTMQNAVDTLEGQVHVITSTQERLARVETRVDSANDTLTRIDQRLASMESRGAER